MDDRGTVLQISTMVPPARYGGAELVVGSFGEQLERAGFRVHNQGLKARHDDGSGLPIPNVYWPFDGRDHRAAQRLAWHGIDALTLSARAAVERLVDEVEPDVMVTHNLRGWGLAPWVVAEQRRIPLVHVIHDYGLLCNSSTLWHGGADCKDSYNPCRLRARAAVRRWPGGLLIGVSDAVLTEHRRRGFGTSGPSGVVHPVLAGQELSPGSRQRTNGVPVTFGYLGRLTAEKGIGLLLDAIAGTGKHLVVAGDGETSQAQLLKERAPGQVQWRGWMEPGPFFDAIDVLVVPSAWREPFGLVVVEAARAGVPVLLADQPGLIEAARMSGARYKTFPANDEQALRASLALPVSEYRTEIAPTPGADIVDQVSQLAQAGRR
ncbi:MAG: glycosyltransferase [Mycobacterium sp.]